jgi:hypothetical protein
MSTQRLAAGLCLAVMIPACGGGGGGSGATPVTTTTTVPCTQTILFQSNGPVPPRTLIPIPFAFNATARLDIVLDWTSPSSPIGVYVVSQGACDLDQFNARSCNFLIRSEPSTVKPRKVSVSNVAPGSYALYIANFSDLDESAAVQIISSSATCAPLSFSPLSSQGPAPSVSRMIQR